MSKQSDVYTQLPKLDDLRKKSIITDAGFETQKAKILNGSGNQIVAEKKREPIDDPIYALVWMRRRAKTVCHSRKAHENQSRPMRDSKRCGTSLLGSKFHK